MNPIPVWAWSLENPLVAETMNPVRLVRLERPLTAAEIVGLGGRHRPFGIPVGTNLERLSRRTEGQILAWREAAWEAARCATPLELWLDLRLDTYAVAEEHLAPGFDPAWILREPNVPGVGFDEPMYRLWLAQMNAPADFAEALLADFATSKPIPYGPRSWCVDLRHDAARAWMVAWAEKALERTRATGGVVSVKTRTFERLYGGTLAWYGAIGQLLVELGEERIPVMTHENGLGGARGGSWYSQPILDATCGEMVYCYTDLETRTRTIIP
jgi:hypothetical protein